MCCMMWTVSLLLLGTSVAELILSTLSCMGASSIFMFRIAFVVRYHLLSWYMSSVCSLVADKLQTAQSHYVVWLNVCRI